jgi:hypothetical protein
MTSARKARASEMLAALAADRFLLFKEADLIALDIPFDLRRETQNKALRYRKERPFDPKMFPSLSPAADNYYQYLEVARRESNYSENYRKKHFQRVKALVERHNELGPFDPPLSSDEQFLVDRWFWHGEHIERWRETCQRNWDALSATERLWFDHKPMDSRWAWEFPGLAPAPHCFYPTEETPERARQKHLLKWVIEDCGEDA